MTGPRGRIESHEPPEQMTFLKAGYPTPLWCAGRAVSRDCPPEFEAAIDAPRAPRGLGDGGA